MDQIQAMRALVIELRPHVNTGFGRRLLHQLETMLDAAEDEAKRKAEATLDAIVEDIV